MLLLYRYEPLLELKMELQQQAVELELRQVVYVEPDQHFPQVVQECMIQMNLTLKQLSQKSKELEVLVHLTPAIATELRHGISRTIQALFHFFEQKRVTLEKLNSDSSHERFRMALENQMNLVLLTASGICLLLDKTKEFELWRHNLTSLVAFYRSYADECPVDMLQKTLANAQKEFEKRLTLVTDSSQESFQQDMIQAWEQVKELFNP